jgi:vancomycin resistance protein YoaR
MKQVIFILLFAASMQAQDTIMLSNVVAKKTVMRIQTKDTSGVETEIREVLTYDKAVKKIEQLTQDTLMLNQRLEQMSVFEKQIAEEKKKARIQKRQSVALIIRLKKLLPRLK